MSTTVDERVVEMRFDNKQFFIGKIVGVLKQKRHFITEPQTKILSIICLSILSY